MVLQSLRDAPDTQREYETIYILRPESNSDEIQEVNGRVRRIIEETGGKVLRLDNWGKRKLAYEVKKQLKGIYLYWHYLGKSELVAEIERNLRMLDRVVRYYTVKIDNDVNPEARPSQMDDDSFMAAATIVPDEEDAYMGRKSAEEGEGYDDRDDEDDEVRAAAGRRADEARAAESEAGSEVKTEAATEAAGEAAGEAKTEAATEADADQAGEKEE